MNGRILLHGAVGFLLLLWSCDIGPETLEPLAKDPEPVAAKSPSKSVAVSSIKREKLKLQNPQKIDQTKFLKIFSQYARRLELIPCLQQATGLETSSLALAGTLTLAGGLSEVRVVGEETQLPACAMKIFSEMDFSELVPTDHPVQQTVYWRIDW